jgi:hypothetical protein
MVVVDEGDLGVLEELKNWDKSIITKPKIRCHHLCYT